VVFQLPMPCFDGALMSRFSNKRARSATNGLRQLERMGLGDALAEVGAKIGDDSEYYRMDGTVVGRMLTTNSTGWNGPPRTCGRRASYDGGRESST
jgi:hypothetical protein